MIKKGSVNEMYKKSPTKIALEKLLLSRNAEALIQKNIVDYIRLRLKDSILFSVPNGTMVENIITRMILFLMGLKTGVSDLILLYQGKVYFLEIKTEKGKQSPEQKQFQKDVEKQGFIYLILRSLDDAERLVDNI